MLCLFQRNPRKPLPPKPLSPTTLARNLEYKKALEKVDMSSDDELHVNRQFHEQANDAKRTLRRPSSQIINTVDNMPPAKHQKLAVGTL